MNEALFGLSTNDLRKVHEIFTQIILQISSIDPEFIPLQQLLYLKNEKANFKADTI